MRSIMVLAAAMGVAAQQQFVLNTASQLRGASKATCTHTTTGSKDIPGADLAQIPDITADACAQKCCDNDKCSAYVFLATGAPAWGGCTAGDACCFLKTTSSGSVPSDDKHTVGVVSRPAPPPPAPTPPPGPTPWPTQDPHNFDSFNKLFVDAVLNVPQLPKIPLNNISFTVSGIPITIKDSWLLPHDLKCGKVQIGDISIDSSDNETHVDWAIIASKIYLQCTTNLEALLNIPGLLDHELVYGQDMTINVTLGTDMEFDYTRKGSDQPCTHGELSKCDFSLGLDLGCVVDPKNHSTDGICDLITNLGPTISTEVAKLVDGPNGFICSEVRNITKKYVDMVLGLEAEAFAWLDGAPIPPLPVSEAEADITEWESTTGRPAVKINTGLLPMIGKLLNSTIGAEKPDGTVGFDQYYDQIFHGQPLTVPLPEKQISLWNVPYLDYVLRLNATFKSITIGGLDTFTHMNLIDVISDFTVATHIAQKSLVINVTVDVATGPGQWVSGGPIIHDTITISFGLKDINILTQTLIGLDKEALERISIYGMEHKPVACLLSTLIKDPSRLSTPGIKFNQLQASISDSQFLLDGTVSVGVDNALRGLGQAFAKGLRRPIVKAIPKITQDVIRPVLNPVLCILIVNAAAAAGDCPAPPPL
eukprot:Hpha_TRINITY_DN16908_c0_g14::TRINITY_DN16908_c0_g14_i1::g.53742::m.53742